MNTEKHTITLPIADYNELISTKDLAGVKRIDETAPIYAAIKEALHKQQAMQHNFASVSNSDPMKGVELFIRVR